MKSLPLKSIHLFRFTGIDVSLHWTWFLVALYEIDAREKNHSSFAWNALVYLALFLMVLLHEFGHALACRQVGGEANRIVLWPLGGAAFVRPPQRPGATLWCLAAGPLVNVALLFGLFGVLILRAMLGWALPPAHSHSLVIALVIINLGLLIFNLLPIYPLDGGQILRALLCYVVGRATSLMVAVIVGFIGVAGLFLFAVWRQSEWMGLMAAFILFCCWVGMEEAYTLVRVAKAPRLKGFACPACKAEPPSGGYWRCNKCRTRFDVFKAQGVCPRCANRLAAAPCFECYRLHPTSEWQVPVLSPNASAVVMDG